MVPETEENPYAAPKTRVRQPRRGDGASPLASRGSRLFAVMIDGLIAAALAVPAILIFPFDFEFTADGELDLSDGVPMGLIVAYGVIGVYTLFQWFLLWTRSQTVGKIAMKIRIEEHGSDERAGPVKTILIRTIAVMLISFVPIIGGLFGLVNVLFIFGREKRCIHDLMAGTVVREFR